MMASLSFFVGKFENLPFSPGGGKSSSGLLVDPRFETGSAAGPKKKSACLLSGWIISEISVCVPALFAREKPMRVCIEVFQHIASSSPTERCCAANNNVYGVQKRRIRCSHPENTASVCVLYFVPFASKKPCTLNHEDFLIYFPFISRVQNRGGVCWQPLSYLQSTIYVARGGSHCCRRWGCFQKELSATESWRKQLLFL